MRVPHILPVGACYIRKWQKHMLLWRCGAENREKILPSNYMHFMKGIILMVALNLENILTLGGLAIGEEY
jgi:hypothetical protein